MELEEAPYLGGGDARERDLGKLVLAEEAHAVRLDVGGDGFSEYLAQIDELVDVVGDGGVVVPVTVVGGDQTHCPHPVARLLVYLPDGSLGRGLSDVGPAARHRPAAVLGLLDEQDAAPWSTAALTSTLGVAGPVSSSSSLR